jgi:mono/diheme cytochrome c family protein
MKVLRFTGYALAALLGLVLVAAIGLYFASERVLRAPAQATASHLATPTAAQRADAPRQLRVLGCLNCHGAQLRGRLFFDEPGVAKLHAPNLTRIAAIASDAELERAIRQGIGHTGKPLFVMPSQEYQFLTDGEVAALIEAIRRFPAGGEEMPPLQVGPLGRIGVVTGKFQTAPTLVAAYRAERLPEFGPQLAHARHIVETNCTECHGPALHGKEVKPGTVAPDLAIALAYSPDQFRALLRTGTAVGNRPLTLMAEVARSDFRALTDAEIDDIHAYLTARAKQGGVVSTTQAAR